MEKQCPDETLPMRGMNLNVCVCSKNLSAWCGPLLLCPRPVSSLYTFCISLASASTVVWLHTPVLCLVYVCVFASLRAGRFLLLLLLLLHLILLLLIIIIIIIILIIIIIIIIITIIIIIIVAVHVVNKTVKPRVKFWYL